MELLMNLLGAAIALYIVVMGINYFPKARAFFRPDNAGSALFDKDLWRKAFKVRKWRYKILLTLAVVGVYKLSSFIIIPGVSYESIKAIEGLFSKQFTGPQWMVIFDGPLGRCHLFTLGLAPYLTACVFLQFFLGLIIPFIRRKLYGGQTGFLAIRKYTLFLAYFLALLYAFSLALSLESFEIAGIRLILQPGWSFRLIAIISWLAGFSLIFWMANLISRCGLGNGWAVLLGADIGIGLMKRIFWGFWTLHDLDNPHHASQPLLTLIYILLLGIFVLFLLGIFRWRRNIPVRVNSVETTLPLDLSWLASYPMFLAVSIILFPTTLALFLPYQGFQGFAQMISRGNFLYYVLVGVSTVFLSRFYMLVFVARPRDLSHRFCRYGAAVTGFSEVDQITGILRSHLDKVAILIGLLLMLFVILPDLIMESLTIPYYMSDIFAGIPFLIVFGVINDITKQLRARMEMDNTGCQTACHILPVESEALIEKCYLESKGISCVIEPYGFTWGLPFRTAGSYYKLHVRPDNVNDASDLLE